MAGKGGRRIEHIKKCVHLCKCKNDTLNCSKNQSREMKKNRGRSEFKYDIFDTL
jgi:hypothetical protein